MRAIALGVVCTATWLEVLGRKQPPSLRVARVRNPGTPPTGPSGETEEGGKGHGKGRDGKNKDGSKGKDGEGKSKGKGKGKGKKGPKGLHEMEEQSSEQEGGYSQEWYADQGAWHEDNSGPGWGRVA